MENKCIMCGEIIPEGRQVCPICERECDAYDPVVVRNTAVPGRRVCRRNINRTGERK